MGARKREMAERQKAIKKQTAIAKLNNVPTSPRKSRLVADMVRGMEVNRALGALHFSTKEASRKLYTLLKSAVSNWEQKTGKKADEEVLYVTEIFVDDAGSLKRLRPAPQGRGYRIRKRSNHVTVYVDTKNTNEQN